MPTVHMISGLIGAGKTTFAHELERRHGAVRFSLDEWIMGAFGPEAPEPMRLEWWVERARRCSTRIYETSERLLALGTDVILDHGFIERSHREEGRALAHRTGASVRLYVVTASAEVRWSRVEARNRDRGQTYALTVTRGMFDSLPNDPTEADEAPEIVAG